MRAPLLPLTAALLLLPGCIATKKQHDDLAREVDALSKKVAQRDEELDVALEVARTQGEELEKLARSNQATVGVRVDDIELELADVRGSGQDTQNEIAALMSNVAEASAQLDGRVTDLEQKLHQENSIPEGKAALYKEAEREQKRKQWRKARKLYRIYLSRYPSDKKEAKVRFSIGLTLFSERDFRSALGEFYWVVQHAPDSDVIHDSLYYSGLAFAKIGQCAKAIAYFAALASDDTAPARYRDRAKEQVETLGKDTGAICEDKGKSREGVATSRKPRPGKKPGS